MTKTGTATQKPFVFCLSQAMYFTAIFPYIMMFVLMLRGLTLPGALSGIKYYLYPQLLRLTDPQEDSQSS